MRVSGLQHFSSEMSTPPPKKNKYFSGYATDCIVCNRAPLWAVCKYYVSGLTWAILRRATGMLSNTNIPRSEAISCSTVRASRMSSASPEEICSPATVDPATASCGWMTSTRVFWRPQARLADSMPPTTFLVWLSIT